ncbi:MAG: hypothetical protein ACPG31_05375 [Planctomycetota bacterium]
MRLSRFLLAFLLLSGVAQAQTVVLADDFDDDIVDPMWTVSFDPLMLWDVTEFNGYFNFDGLSAPFGATDERYSLAADLTAPVHGAFQLDIFMEWEDQPGMFPGEAVEFFMFRLLDASGAELAHINLDDNTSGDAGDFVFGLPGTNHIVAGLPPDVFCEVILTRDANDALDYEILINGSVFASGNVGTMPGTVASVEMYLSHTTPCGPCGPFLGQLRVDDVEMLDLNTGPSLSTLGIVAGTTVSFDVVNASPSGLVILGYSLAGGGPTNTIYGIADMTAPIQQFPGVTADVLGTATFLQAVPSSAAGVSVWLQALDLSAGVLTNSLAEVVQ